MKMLVVVSLALVAAVAAAPAEVPAGTVEPIKTLRSSYEQSPDGNFESSFETENGIKSQVVGELKVLLDEDKKEVKVVVQRGSYSYPGEDGKPVLVQYIADENGFQPEGDSIPKLAASRR